MADAKTEILITAVDAASAVFAKIGSNFGALRNKVGEVGAQVSSMGKTMLIAGTAGGVGLGVALHKASEFGAGIAEVSTLVDGAAFSVEDMRKIVLKSHQAFGGDIKAQTKALYQGISAGAADASSATELMDSANKLAIAGVTDVSTAVDGLTNVLNAYGQKFTKDNLTQLSDAFLVGIAKGKVTVAELAANLGKVAPSASAVGISMTDLIGAVSAISTKGIVATEAITGIKAALAVISHPSKDASEEAKRLGIEFSEAAIRAKGLPKFLESITKNSKTTADTFTKLFGGSIEAKNAMQALAGGGDTFNEILAAMDGRAGGTDRAFQIMIKSALKQFDLLKASVEQILIEIGEAVMPIAGPFIETAKRIANAFLNLPKPVKVLIGQLVLLAVVVTTVAGAMLVAAGAIASLFAVSEVVVIAFAVALGVMTQLGAVFLFVGAAAGLMYLAIKENVGGIGDFFEDTFGKARLAVLGLAALFSDGEISGPLADELLYAKNEGVLAFIQEVYKVGAAIKNFFAGFGQGFTEGLTQLGPGIDDLKAALTELFSVFGMSTTSVDATENRFMAFGEAGKSLASTLIPVAHGVVSAITWMVDMVSGAMKQIKLRFPLEGFAQILPVISNAVSLFFSLFSALSGGASSSSGAMQGLGTVVGVVINGIAYAVLIAGHALALLVNLFTNAVSSIKSIFGGVIDIVTGVIGFIAAFVNDDKAGMLNALKSIALGIVKVIVGVFGLAIGQILAGIDAVAGVFGKDLGLQKAFEGAKKEFVGDMQMMLGIEKSGADEVGGMIGGKRDVTPVQDQAPTLRREALPQPIQNFTPAEVAQSTYVANQSLAPPPPVNANLATNITVQMDSQKVAEEVAKQSLILESRNYSSTPALSSG